MQRIKGVAGVLERFAVMPLFAAVQPDRDQRQQRETLPHQEIGFISKVNFVTVSAQNFHVNVPQTEKLPDIAPPFALTEEIECKNHQNTGVVIVHHREKSRKTSDNDGRAADQNANGQLSALFCLLVPVDQTDRDQKAPQDILMDRIKQAAARDEIERNLGDHGKEQQSADISLQIFGAEISLDEHKSKDGEGDAANAGQPVISRHDRAP